MTSAEDEFLHRVMGQQRAKPEPRPSTALPNDEQAERAILGLALNQGRLPEAAETLRPPDFYRPVNETLWAAILSLAGQSRSCDVISLRAHLQQRGSLDTRDGVPSHYLAELLNTPSAVDSEYVTGIIRGHAGRRRLIELHQRGLQRAQDVTTDLETLLRNTQADLESVVGNGPIGASRQADWLPVDLTAVLDGTWQPPLPTVGKRSDGCGMFYPGKHHSAIGETESAKTWFALSAGLDEMAAGNHVLFIDFEDDEGTIVSRLLAISGQSTEMIRERFHYLRPDGPLSPANRSDLDAVLHDCRPTLAICDGITEAMVLHGWDPLKNADVALFNALIIKPLTNAGAAAVALDHVVKDREGRGRYALGGVHKLNAVSGAGYLLENRQPFGIGLTGRSTIKITKDRPGQLRPYSRPSSGGLFWYGDLVLRSHHSDFAEVTVEPPHEHEDGFRPTELMTKIAAELGKAVQPMSQRELLKLVKGRDETKREAFARLIAEGNISSKTPHTLLKPFESESE
jgi:hypothetical protein